MCGRPAAIRLGLALDCACTAVGPCAALQTHNSTQPYLTPCNMPRGELQMRSLSQAKRELAATDADSSPPAWLLLLWAELSLALQTCSPVRPVITE